MEAAIKLNQVTSVDQECKLMVHIGGTPLALPGHTAVHISVAAGTPLVWVIGMLAADRRAYDRFTELVDRGALTMRLNGQKAGWWQEVEGDGVLALLHRPEGMEIGREAGGVARLDPQRPLSLETPHQSFPTE